MEPQNIRFGGGLSETLLHPAVAVALVIVILLMFLLPRKYVIAPFLLTVLLFPLGQVLVVGGVHFTYLRIVTLFGLGRWATAGHSWKKGSFPGGFNSIDITFALWALSFALAFSLLYMETQALINRVGFLLDALGGYFLLRCLVRDTEDVRRVIKLFVVISAVVAIAMINEQLTKQNIFGLLGGIRSVPEIRSGEVRSQGVFQHSLLAGSVGATLLPLFVWLWNDRKARIGASVGIISSTVMVVASSCSTPVLSYAAAVFALCFWPLRKWMRTFRWGILLTLVGLHLVMKAPVWALISRVDLTGSSSSYQRFLLVDNFFRHIGDWWLLGTKNYNNWGWDMWDLSNQFVLFGLRGGLATVVFFIAMISRSFGRLGRASKRVEGDRKQEWFLWCLGAALFAHVVAYFGVGYDEQVQIEWFTLLAIISAVTFEAMRPAVVQVDAVADRYVASVPRPIGVRLFNLTNRVNK